MNTIYKLNFPNGKSYIGQTTQPINRRLYEHKYASKIKKYPLHNAIKKYGWNNVEVTILYQGINMVNIDHAERYFIREYNTLVPNGYNVETGGNKNKNCTPWNKGKKNCFTKATLKKMSESQKGNKNGKGIRPRSYKPVVQYSKEGKFIQNYESINKAAHDLNLSPSNISAVLTKREKSAGGYIWRYI